MEEKYLKRFDLPVRLKILFNLMYLPNKEMGLSDIERFLGYNTSRIETRELFDFFKKEGILTQTKKIYMVNFYKLDKNKLLKFIKSLNSYKEFVKLIKKTNIIIW